LWAATHAYHPDALDEGLNLEYLAKTHRAFWTVVTWAQGAGTPDLAGLSYQGFSYGPWLYVTGAIANSTLGLDPWVSLITVQVGVSVGLLATFEVAHRLTGRATAGLLAAGLLASMPMVLYYSRHFTTDTWVLGWTAAIAAAVLHTRGYQRLLPTLVLGLFAGLGLLTKIVIPHLVTFPLSAYFVWTVVLGRAFPGEEAPLGSTLFQRLRRAAAPLAAGLSLTFAISWVYFRHTRSQGTGQGLAEQARGYELSLTGVWGIVPIEAYPRSDAWTTVDWLLFYPNILLRYQLGVPLLVICSAGALFALARRRPGTAWLVGSWVFALLLFTGLVAKKWYYTLPALPYLAAAAAIGIDDLVRAQKRKSVQRAVALAIAIPVVVTAWWVGWYGRPTPIFNQPELLQVAPSGGGTESQDRAVAAFSAAIMKERVPERETTVVVVSDLPFKRGHRAGQRGVYAFLHRLQAELTPAAPPVRLQPAELRSVLYSWLWPGNERCFDPARLVLYATRKEATWLTAEDLDRWPPWGSGGRWLDEGIDRISSEGVSARMAEAQDAAIILLAGRLRPLARTTVGEWTLVLSRIDRPKPIPRK
jgi:hypothetical protein